MPFYRFSELSRKEMVSVAHGSVFVLPIGATEQHGPHLPTGVDAMVVTYIAESACQAAGEVTSVVVAPTLPFGNSHYHLEYGAALSLTPETLLHVLNDILFSAAQSGFCKIFILNGHGGNDEVIRLAVREVVRRYEVTAAAVSYWTIAESALTDAGLISSDWPVPGHAGRFETSLMMALRYDLIKQLPVANAEHRRGFVDYFRGAFYQEPHTQVGVNGYTDDANGANDEYGEKALSIITRAVNNYIQGMAAVRASRNRESVQTKYEN